MSSHPMRWTLTLMALLAPCLSAQDRPGSIYRPDLGPRGIIGSKTAFRRDRKSVV